MNANRTTTTTLRRARPSVAGSRAAYTQQQATS
jgi:hypothetical protein